MHLTVTEGNKSLNIIIIQTFIITKSIQLVGEYWNQGGKPTKAEKDRHQVSKAL